MADVTVLQVYPAAISNVSQVTQTTVLTQTSGTINLGSLSLSSTDPVDVARTASAGVAMWRLGQIMFIAQQIY